MPGQGVRGALQAEPTMLEAVELPTGIADLAASLAHVDGDALSLRRHQVRKVCLSIPPHYISIEVAFHVEHLWRWFARHGHGQGVVTRDRVGQIAEGLCLVSRLNTPCYKSS